MPRFLEMEREHGSLIRALRKGAVRGQADQSASGARYGLFATLAGGISDLLDALADRVASAATVRLESSVAAIKPHPEPGGGGSGIHLTLTNGADHEFHAAVITAPAYRAADIVAGFAPDWARLLARIEYASSAIVVSGHRLADIRHPLDAFGLVVPAAENRKILAVSFTSRKFAGRAPEGRVQLRTFVGGAMQPELFALSDEEIRDLVRRELAEILGVAGTEDFMIVARYPRAMPQYHVGHLDLVAKIEAAATPYPQLALAGNAYYGVGIPDCIHSGEQAAERLIAAAEKTRKN